MTEQEILQKVREITAEKIGQPIDKVHSDSSFQQDLGFDSLDISEMVMDIEDAFRVSVPEEKIESLVTPQKVTDLLKSLLEEKA